MELATRYNQGKPRWSLVDFDALIGLVRALEYGADKYGEYNYRKGHKKKEVIDSLLRHTFALLREEEEVDESGVSHIGHIQANAMFLGMNNLVD